LADVLTRSRPLQDLPAIVLLLVRQMAGNAPPIPVYLPLRMAWKIL
jgi:hypothetical protein